MNLVQINERLKDLPMQVVQQYANGMNPEVPPYLALGELQRREMSQKQATTAQGAQQGPQPSVKEQMEQKAGLMQLQQMQQQQMQQMQPPRGPMPVPAGAPQPQMQPEAPQAMMARGGLAGIPVRRDMFEYASGGIIAFQAGGQPKYETPYDRRNRENREAAQKSAQERVPKAMEVTESNAQALAETAQARVNELESKREELTRRFGPNMYEQALTKAKQEVEAASSRGSELIAQQSAMGQERMAAATPPPAAPFGSKFAPVNPADMMGSPAGLPAALAKAAPTAGAQPPAAPRPTAPRPAASATAAAPTAGLPGAAAAMNPQDEVARLALDAVRTPAKAMTPEEAMAQEGKFASQYGLDKKFGEEERGLLAAMQQRQSQYLARRPMSELGATLRGFGQGYGGAGAASERAEQETFNADMAHQREMLNAVNAINKTNLDTGKERYKSSGSLFAESDKSTAAANRDRTQTLGNMRNKDIDAATAAANRLSDMERAKMDRAVRMAEINNPGSSANIRNDYLKMMDQVFDLESKGEKDKADALRKRADTRLAASSGSAAVAAGTPKAMTRDQASDNVNKDLENLVTAKKTIADAKAALAARGEANPTMAQIKEHLIQEQMKGVPLPTAGSSGKVPLPPLGFTPDKP